jgi:hypothetical protein
VTTTLVLFHLRKKLLASVMRSETRAVRIWAQLGCNKNSRGFLRAPRVAIGAVKLLLNPKLVSSNLTPAITFGA